MKGQAHLNNLVTPFLPFSPNLINILIQLYINWPGCLLYQRNGDGYSSN